MHCHVRRGGKFCPRVRPVSSTSGPTAKDRGAPLCPASLAVELSVHAGHAPGGCLHAGGPGRPPGKRRRRSPISKQQHEASPHHPASSPNVVHVRRLIRETVGIVTADQRASPGQALIGRGEEAKNGPLPPAHRVVGTGVL